MKTLGLIGGMSWESSLEYYRIINESVKYQLGGLHSAKCILLSVDFHEIEKLQDEGNWSKLTQIMIDCARTLTKAGSDAIVICTNTMHKMAKEVEENIDVPLLHIADATAAEIKDKGLKIVGLLGTQYTMEQDFYKGRLEKKHGLGIVIPELNERTKIHDIIYKELCLGKINDSSKEVFKEIINNLINNGAEGIILGCTEIPLLIKQQDVRVPIFDTTTIHADYAVKYAIN